MNIGNIELSAPLALAPMAGITDLPFRLICRRLGCGMTVSEMVSAKGLLYKNVKTTEMLRIDDGERPTAIQLFGSVPAELAEAARMVEASGADMIDFNMGCPCRGGSRRERCCRTRTYSSAVLRRQGRLEYYRRREAGSEGACVWQW